MGKSVWSPGNPFGGVPVRLAGNRLQASRLVNLYSSRTRSIGPGGFGASLSRENHGLRRGLGMPMVHARMGFSRWDPSPTHPSLRGCPQAAVEPYVGPAFELWSWTSVASYWISDLLCYEFEPLGPARGSSLSSVRFPVLVSFGEMEGLSSAMTSSVVK